MKDDPREIAAWLIQQHGLAGARQHALGGVLKAQQDNDKYALSVWREIRRVLAAQEQNAETGSEEPER